MTLPPFQLERYYAAHEFKTKFMLSSSDCESWTIGALLDLEPESRSAFEHQWLGYTDSLGSHSLRTEIARIYTSINPDQILVHSGAGEAIFLYFHAVLTPGQHVIVQTPCYQSLIEIPRSIGCEITPWPMEYDGRWDLKLEALESIMRPDTRLIVVNSPHNPTGHHMSLEFQSGLFEIAERHNCLVFFDEVYRELEYDVRRRLPAACDLFQRGTSLGVMSKSYGLPGLRTGWVATHDTALLTRMAELKDYTTICNSAPSEFLAALALRHREALTSQNLQIIQNNLDLLDAFFAQHANQFEWSRPIAGPIAFPKLKTTTDAEPFCLHLIQKANVLLLPGTVYGEPTHFRIGFGRRNLPEALAAMNRAITMSA